MTENTIQLSMNTELPLIARDVPSQRTHELVIQPPTAAHNASRPKLNLALVLDRSGSMSGDKLHFVKLAAQHLVDIMDE
jgi:Ca-activated chloride channel family protein